ncbi:hypothetical protein KSS87_022639 [Heliosperma pusillum]|nr:hypothetical protein KSS87_022639 [Heliosperma pusillum]
MEAGAMMMRLKSLNHLHLLFTSTTRTPKPNHFRLSPSLSLSTTCPLSALPSDKLTKDITRLPQPVNPAQTSCTTNNLLQVVLIPGNSGSIARTCAAAGVKLHLVEPLGFAIDHTKLKRAGLDYWPYVVVKVHPSWTHFRDFFLLQDGDKRLLAFTKKGTTIHSDFTYKPGDWLVFGSETSGLPPDVLSDCRNDAYGGGTLKIPMVDTYVRCLNLSVSVGIAIYEAARQLNYEQLQSSSEACVEDERGAGDDIGLVLLFAKRDFKTMLLEKRFLPSARRSRESLDEYRVQNLLLDKLNIKPVEIRKHSLSVWPDLRQRGYVSSLDGLPNMKQTTSPVNESIRSAINKALNITYQFRKSSSNEVSPTPHKNHRMVESNWDSDNNGYSFGEAKHITLIGPLYNCGGGSRTLYPFQIAEYLQRDYLSYSLA